MPSSAGSCPPTCAPVRCSVASTAATSRPPPPVPAVGRGGRQAWGDGHRLGPRAALRSQSPARLPDPGGPQRQRPLPHGRAVATPRRAHREDLRAGRATIRWTPGTRDAAGSRRPGAWPWRSTCRPVGRRRVRATSLVTERAVGGLARGDVRQGRPSGHPARRSAPAWADRTQACRSTACARSCAARTSIVSGGRQS